MMVFFCRYNTVVSYTTTPIPIFSVDTVANADKELVKYKSIYRKHGLYYSKTHGRWEGPLEKKKN